MSKTTDELLDFANHYKEQRDIAEAALVKIGGANAIVDPFINHSKIAREALTELAASEAAYQKKVKK